MASCWSIVLRTIRPCIRAAILAPQMSRPASGRCIPNQEARRDQPGDPHHQGQGAFHRPQVEAWRSSRYIGATRQETRLPGFEAATEAASDLGFPVLVRNSGGGAVAANRGSLSFSLTFPVEDLRHGLYERYAGGLDLIASALRRIGVEAERGEVEGEFCPGAYSVRSGGPWGIKHAGLAQRVTRRSARLEALVLVSETDEVRAVLA